MDPGEFLIASTYISKFRYIGTTLPFTLLADPTPVITNGMLFSRGSGQKLTIGGHNFTLSGVSIIAGSSEVKIPYFTDKRGIMLGFLLHAFDGVTHTDAIPALLESISYLCDPCRESVEIAGAVLEGTFKDYDEDEEVSY